MNSELLGKPIQRRVIRCRPISLAPLSRWLHTVSQTILKFLELSQTSGDAVGIFDPILPSSQDLCRVQLWIQNRIRPVTDSQASRGAAVSMSY